MNYGSNSTQLTKTENSVVELLAEDGADNILLAQTMGVSTHTIKVHLRNIFDKTGAENRTQLAVRHLRKKMNFVIEESKP